jgi:Glycosyl hydrolase family 65, N-terminal domain
MKSRQTSRRLFLKRTAAAAGSALADAAGGWPVAASVMADDHKLPAQPTSSSVLSLRQPASVWVEGLPLANGVSAAMVWGLPSRVVLSLNHVDFWRDHLGKEIGDYSKYVREAQRLMLDGKAKEANDAYRQNVNMSVMPRQKKSYPRLLTGYTNSFQPIGNIVIDLEYQLWVTEYRRSLDMQTAVARITYKYRDGEQMRQEFSFRQRMTPLWSASLRVRQSPERSRLIGHRKLPSRKTTAGQPAPRGTRFRLRDCSSRVSSPMLWQTRESLPAKAK